MPQGSQSSHDASLAKAKIERIREKPVSSMTGSELAYIYKHGSPTKEEILALKNAIAQQKKQGQGTTKHAEASHLNSPTQQNHVTNKTINAQSNGIEEEYAPISVFSRKRATGDARYVPTEFDIASGDDDELFDMQIDPPDPSHHIGGSVDEDGLPQRARIADLTVDDADEFYRAKTEHQVRARRSASKSYRYDNTDEVSDVVAEIEAPTRESNTNRTVVSKVGTLIKNALHEPVFIIAFIMLMFIVVFLRPSLIPSGSMIPTLQIGDRILSIAQYFPNGHTYNRGDIACFIAPSGETYVKRVIGIGGDHIQISGEKIYVNGEESPYQGTGGVMTSMDIQLADDEYWMMGDNRGNSQDSRFLGPIKADKMVSKVFAIYYPADRIRLL